MKDKGYLGVLLTDKWMDIGDCRVAFVIENKCFCLEMLFDRGPLQLDQNLAYSHL